MAPKRPSINLYVEVISAKRIRPTYPAKISKSSPSVCSSRRAATFKPAGLLRVALKPGEDNDLLLLNKPKLTLGRDASNDVSIESVEISRKHCIFKFKEGRWWIVDLNSTSGVFIRGNRLKAGEKVMLKDGHRISFGPEAKSSYKYLFREDMSHLPHTQLALSSSSSSTSQTIINPINGCENFKNEIIRLRLKKEQVSNQVKDLKKQNRSMKKRHEDRYSKLIKKIGVLKVKEKKHLNLISQLKDRIKNDTDSNRCVTATTISEKLLSIISNEFRCSICSEYFVSPTCLGCSHVFCLPCIEQWKKAYKLRCNQISNGICPVCRTEIESQTHMRSYENLFDLLLNVVHDDKQKKILFKAS